MSLFTIILAFIVLILIGLLWFGIHYWGNSPLHNPDCYAKLTGDCGDTMEIEFTIVDGAVDKTRHWTDGCSVSQQCIEAAAMLARGKTVAELQKISMMQIMDIVGQLPETHLHCALLAENTLQLALKDYNQPPP